MDLPHLHVSNELERLAVVFGRFAEEAQDLASPLYSHLSRQIAQDEEVLAIAREVRRPPEPNVLFAAVHFLLMDGGEHSLARFYGSLCHDPRPAAEAYPDFREFLRTSREMVLPILRTRATQTNEVRRCSYLLPAFSEIYESAGKAPLALIDVGCSAGLHLNWDRYYYDYGAMRAGDAEASVKVRCELRGPGKPPVPAAFPECAYRVGIDLNPVDLTDPVERQWFEALIWPDHPDRRKLARAAARELLRNPPNTVKGDAVHVLSDELRKAPLDATLVVYNSHALYQGSQEELECIQAVLRNFSTRRPIYWLSCEGSEAHLRAIRDSKVAERKLANKDSHGRWLEWL